MKKYLIGIICSLIIFVPSMVNAKKIACGNEDYMATVEIDKEEFSLKEKAFIAVNSEFEYENVTYLIDNKEIAEISKEGIVKPLKDGSGKITTIIKFTKDTSCQVEVPIKILSNDSSLKSLNLEEFDLSSVFAPDKYDYEVILPYKNDKINILAEANGSGATITGDGRRFLNEGVNIFNITVTATDGTKSTYKISVTRNSANDDATLSSLIIDGFTIEPKFTKDNFKYELKVGKDINEINIKAKATYNFTKIYGPGKKQLATGLNIFFIRVIAESGHENRYEISVTKSDGKVYLDDLIIQNNKLSPRFQEDIYTYNLTVPNEITKLELEAIAKDKQVEVMGNNNFQEGDNEVIIRVTDKNKEVSTYKIIVNRLSKVEEKEKTKNNILLTVLLVLFIISIGVMIFCIVLFIQKNKKKKYHIKYNNKKSKGKKNNKK